jgi:hypothetical protein
LIINREWRTLLRNSKDLEKYLTVKPVIYFNTFLTMIFIMLTFVIFRAPDMPHAFNVLASLTSLEGDCTLLLPVVKAGLIPIMSIYFLVFVITEYLKRNPEPFSFMRDPVCGYAYPLKLASWTAAVILTVAARPLTAVPFVYFQF